MTGYRGAGAPGHRWMAAVAVCAALSCTDPRARPVPPLVEVQFGPTFRLTSPGQILGAVRLFDDDGLSTLVLSVFSDDSSFAADSTIFLPGDFDFTRPINWTVPTGLATGTFVTVVASAEDFAGFITTDTVKLAVQDSTAALR